MRIGIEATALCNPTQGGIQRYTRRLVETLHRTGAVASLALYYRLSRFRSAERRLQLPGVPARWVQEPLWPLIKGVDLVHGTDARVPNWRGVVRVATLHDVFALVSDRFAQPSFRAKKIASYERLSRTCHHIVADSASTRDDFARHFPHCDPTRLSVVHLGVDECFEPVEAEHMSALRKRFDLHAPFILYVGELSARKNLPRMIEAFCRSRIRHDFEFVLCGKPGFGYDEARNASSSLDGTGRVRWLGFVEDEALPTLYSAAAALAFVTCYEGFGLPVLEAMRCGTPVATANLGSTVEVAGGHAALAHPESAEEIAAAMESAVECAPARREAARQHARSFTWDRCARQTLEIWRRTLSREGRRA